MPPFSARPVENVRRRIRRLVGSLGVVALLVSSAVVLDAGTADAAGPGSVSGVSVSLSTNAAGATEVDYSIGFTTSATGGLRRGTGTITISTSAPTVFRDGCDYLIFDVTHDSFLGSCPSAITNSSVTLPTGHIRPGDRVRVVTDQVVNAWSTGSQTLTVSTSADLPGSTGYSLVGASPVSGVTVKLSNTGVSANATYSVTFIASATGALDPSNGTIMLVGPRGTVFPDTGCNDYEVIDVTTSTSSLACPSSALAGGVAVANLGVDIGAGDTVTVVAQQVESTKTPGEKTFKVATTSDLAGKGTFELT
jgi:hypothetical protein